MKRVRFPMIVLALGAACAGAPASSAAPANGGVLEGVCEASAIVPWQGGYLVGDNEGENALYSYATDMRATGMLALTAPVEDIEALAVGPTGELLVVGSQGANKKGKPRPGRERVLVQGGAAVRPDLAACPTCVAARALPPKEGGLSVEGAAWWGEAWWLGVRSPLVDGKAALLKLSGDPASAVTAEPPVPLDLGGYGVRDLVPTPEGLLVLAGPTGGGGGAHRLYRVSAPGAPAELVRSDLPAGSEGLLPVGDELLVVIDGDGKPGGACKEPARWARLPAAGAR